jgi:hypothetical protein
MRPRYQNINGQVLVDMVVFVAVEVVVVVVVVELLSK